MNIFDDDRKPKFDPLGPLTGVLEAIDEADSQTAQNSRTPTIVRNNNPGAIEDGDFARSQPGYVAGGGRFARFATEQDGVRAQERLLATSPRYRGKDIVTILNSYTPPHPENPPEARNNYIGYLAARTGLDPRQPVPAAKIPLLASAMREFETGNRANVKVTPYSGDSSGATEMSSAPPAPVATPEELANMRKPLDTQFVDIVNRVPDVKTRSAQNEDAAGDVLMQALEGLGRVQTAAGKVRGITESTALANAETQRGIIETDKTYRTELQRRLVERRALVERRQEVQNMNPFQRFFKGLVDSKYDTVEIDRAIRHNAEDIAVLQDDYKSLTNADLALVEHSNQLAASETLNASAPVAENDANYGASVRVAQASGAHLQSVLATISSQTQVTTAQTNMENDILTNTSEGALAVAESEAQQNGGKTTINGVEISLARITEARQGQTRARQQMRLADLAAERGELELQEVAEENAIKAMTPGQRQQALQQGGVFNGTQLNVAKLAQAVEVDNKVTQSQVAAKLAPDMMAQYQRGLTAMNESISPDVQRIAQLGGGSSPDMIAYFQALETMNRTHATALRSATAAGNPASILPALSQELQQVAAMRTKALKEVATNWAGGNKTLARIAEGFLTGAGVSQTEAVQALVAQARGQLGNAGTVSPAGQLTINFVKGFVNKWDTDHRAKADEAGMVRALTQALNTRRSQFIVDEAFQSIPDLAKNVKVNGQPHPLSQIPKRDFAAAISAGDRAGLEAIAKGSGINPRGLDDNQLLAALRGKGIKDDAIYAAQLSGLYTVLDRQFSRNGFDASAAFADLLERQEFMGQLGRFNELQGSKATIGDFLVTSGLGQGGAAQASFRAIDYRNAYTMWRRDRIYQAAFQDMATTPADEIRNFGGAMDGITPQEIERLATTIHQMVPYEVPMQAGNRRYQMERIGLITKFLSETKFDDAGLEGIRKKFLRQWPDAVKWIGAANQEKSSLGHKASLMAPDMPPVM